MLTQVVAGRVFDFSHEVRGNNWGTRPPVALAVGEGDAVYVANRGLDYFPNVHWNRTIRGNRFSKLTIGKAPDDDGLVGEFGKDGDAPGEFIWPAGLALDSQENVYVTDEWLDRVSIFDKEGNFLRMWGSAGDDEGEFNGPSGIAIDQQDELYIVDSRNHRIQKFTKDGQFLGTWGSFGAAGGEFDSPWGITIDGQGFIYVADHKNHRVQKFTPEGHLVATFGGYGSGDGELNRPSDVAVDPDGDVYVSDWANDRVQVFGADGRFVTSFLGDAQVMSKSARMTVETNPETMKRIREMRNPEIIGRLSMPTAVAFDAKKDRLIVADSQRGRLQLYDKLRNYVQPGRSGV